MKRIASIAFMATLLLALLGLSPAGSQPGSKSNSASGEIVGGFRVLEVAGAAREMNLVVYRGDYIKFKLADPAPETVLSIPALSIRQRLSGNLDEAHYFKMENSGVFSFSLGALEGSITVVDYQQANYREITSKDAAELIRHIAPLVLDVRTPGEYSRGHLKDSVLIPLQQLQVRWPEIAGHKDKDVLIYCATGNRSTVAAKILIDSGFKRIYNLRQGISGWEREKYPVVQ
jgi:rhodanese-related sulfurtransferase